MVTTLTYIAARLAGFNRTKASIIAYSAQYVDDATNSGVIHFKNGAMYSRISSAHKCWIIAIQMSWQTIVYGFHFIFCLAMAANKLARIQMARLFAS